MDTGKSQTDTPCIKKKNIIHFWGPQDHFCVKSTRRKPNNCHRILHRYLLPFSGIPHFDCGYDSPRQYSNTSPTPQGIVKRQQQPR
jgi:hypothetical protein